MLLDCQLFRRKGLVPSEPGCRVSKAGAPKEEATGSQGWCKGGMNLWGDRIPAHTEERVKLNLRRQPVLTYTEVSAVSFSD